MSGLILPGDPEFDRTLATPPPGWRDAAAKDGDTFAFVVEPGSGLVRCVGSQGLEDYLNSGEYDERLQEIDDDYKEEEEEEEDFLYLPFLPLVVSPSDIV